MNAKQRPATRSAPPTTTPALGRFARAVTLLITWATKIVGLVSATDQLLLHGDHPSSLALGVSAFMIAGGQFSEGLVLSVIDRITGRETEHELHEHERERQRQRGSAP